MLTKRSKKLAKKLNTKEDKFKIEIIMFLRKLREPDAFQWKNVCK